VASVVNVVGKVPSGIPISSNSNSSEPINPKPKKASQSSQDSPREDPSPRDGEEKPQPLFKSQFWTFVDPKKYPPKEILKKEEKEKTYDPTSVKSFMEKKKEIRRLKEKHEMAERQMEIDRRQAQLKELENKRREICAKASVSIARKPAPPDFTLVQDSTSHNHKSTASRTVVPVRAASKSKKTAKQGSKKNVDHPNLTSPAHKAALSAEDREFMAKNLRHMTTDMILQQFESIVHRECVEVLRQHTDRMMTNMLEPLPPRDKAVETTRSLLEDDTESVSTYKSHPLYVRKLDNQSKRYASDSFEVRTNAALKIQAAYRSYRVRKVWHEVASWRDHNERPRRRISFYRPRGSAASHVQTPERSSFEPSWMGLLGSKPRKLAAMSPGPGLGADPPVSSGKTAFGISVDFSSYIPAPKGFTDNPNSAMNYSTLSSSTPEQSSRSFRYPGVSPAVGTKGTPSRFEEPFPKEAIKQLLLQTPKPASNDGMGLGRRSLTNFYPSPALGHKVSESRIRPETAFVTPAPKEGRDPTFYAVLKEQIRLLQEKAQVDEEAVMVKTPPVRRSSLSQLSQDYDSDSTEHQSLSRPSTPSLSITDDYIGPNMEEMKKAYSMRQRDRLSLEPNINLHRQRLIRPAPADLISMPPPSRGKVRVKDAADTSIGSTTTVETDDELKDVPKPPPAVNLPTTEPETTYDLPTPIRNFQHKLEQERLNILEAASKFKTEMAIQQRAEAEAIQQQAREDTINEVRFKHILSEIQNVKDSFRNSNHTATLLESVTETVKAVAESLNRPSTVHVPPPVSSATRIGFPIIHEETETKHVKTQTSVGG